jgi:hypothetical protein
MEGGYTAGEMLAPAAGKSETKALYVYRPSNVMRRQKTPLNDSTMNANTTTENRETLIQMFLDGSSNEVYADGRLITRESGESTVELIAYGWNKIAEYNESTDTVTLFAGHAGNVSKAVTEYVNLVDSISAERESRTLNKILEAAPNVARPPAESAQFIDNYRSFDGNPSSVEEWATDTVERSISDAISSLI